MLTDDMTRLCGEIVSLRKRRGELLDSLERESKARRASVSGMCEQFANARAEMGRSTKSDRLSFLRNLQHTVQMQQRAMQSDLAGVRRAWAGA